jgi:hypothetical protein
MSFIRFQGFVYSEVMTSGTSKTGVFSNKSSREYLKFVILQMRDGERNGTTGTNATTQINFHDA